MSVPFAASAYTLPSWFFPLLSFYLLMTNVSTAFLTTRHLAASLLSCGQLGPSYSVPYILLSFCHRTGTWRTFLSHCHAPLDLCTCSVWVWPGERWPHPVQGGGDSLPGGRHHSDHLQGRPQLVAGKAGEHQERHRGPHPLTWAAGVVSGTPETIICTVTSFHFRLV